MPYSSNFELPESIKNTLPVKAQTIFRKAYNGAYESYDGDAAKANATAWSQVKTKYEKRNKKWVLIKPKVVSGGLNLNLEIPEDGWVAAAKVGQEALLSPNDTIVKYTEEGLRNYADSLQNLDITYNHDNKRKINGESIVNAKFEDQYLYMQISNQIKEAIKNKKVSGLSIEGIPKKIEDGWIIDIEGTALSLMEYPQLPACKIEEGCGIVTSSILEQVDVTQMGEHSLSLSTTSRPYVTGTSTTYGESGLNVSSQAIEASDDTSKYFDVYVVNNMGNSVKIGTDSVWATKKELKDPEYIKSQLMQRAGQYNREKIKFYNADTTMKLGDSLQTEKNPIHEVTTVISKQVPELLESDNRYLIEQNKSIEKSSLGGDAKEMEGKEPLTYSGDQVNQMVASAETKIETALKNQHEVDLTELKDKEKKAQEELATAHATELKEAAKQSFRKAQAITTFEAKFKPSDEVLTQAKEIDPIALEFFNGLDIPMSEPQSGVTSAAQKADKEEKDTYEDIKTRYNKKLGRGTGAK